MRLKRLHGKGRPGLDGASARRENARVVGIIDVRSCGSRAYGRRRADNP